MSNSIVLIAWPLFAIMVFIAMRSNARVRRARNAYFEAKAEEVRAQARMAEAQANLTAAQIRQREITARP